jgi:hypothetical protein
LTPAQCPGPPNEAAYSYLLGLSWPGTSGMTTVSYWSVRPTNSINGTVYVVRTTCANETTNGPYTPTSVVTLTHLSSGQQAPTTPISCTSPTTGPCANAAGGWSTVDGATGISLVVTESQSSLPYNILAVPRTWQGPAGGSPPSPLLLTDGSGNPIVNVQSSGDALNVTGAITLDGYGTSPTDDVTLATGTSFSDTTGPFDVYCSVFPTCPSSLFNTPALYTGPSPTSLPPPPTPAPQPPTFTAPTPPTTPSWTASMGCTPVGSGSLSTANSTLTCAPGVYTTGIDITAANVKVTFGAGNYAFDGDISAQKANDTIIFQTGVYTFVNPGSLLNIEGTTDTVTGTGVLLNFQGGDLSVTDPSNSITLSAATTGMYSNWLLYQSDSLAMTLYASSASNDVLTGVVDAPSAAVTVEASTTKMFTFATSLVSSSLSVSSQSGVTMPGAVVIG